MIASCSFYARYGRIELAALVSARDLFLRTAIESPGTLPMVLRYDFEIGH